MTTWKIDANAGMVGAPGICCNNAVDIELEQTPEYIQIEHEVNLLSFLTWNDIEVIDEVNDCEGELTEAAARLKTGQAYFIPEANVSIIKL